MRMGFLDLRRLRYFQTIVRLGSLSAAARQMNVAQPAMSHHVAELEKSLGGAILVRHQAGVRPTSLGVTLDAYATEILDIVARAERELLFQARGTVDVPVVHLAIIPSLASALAPVLLTDFSQIVPNVELHLIDARTAFGNELIESGKADIAIQLVSPEEVTDEPLAWEALYWVTPAEDGPDSHFVSFRSVLQATLILPSVGNPLRRYLQSAADREGFRLEVARSVDGPEPRQHAVMAGLGTTIFGAHTVAADLLGPQLRARRIVSPELERPIVMAVRPGFDAAIADAVRSALRHILAGMPSVPETGPDP